MANGHGGKRLGAGAPLGTKWAATLKKEAVRELVRQTVTAELGPLLEAQIAAAKGIEHFFLRDAATGQFRRITDPCEIEQALNSGDEGKHYWIFTKDPSTPAFTELLNRALDKPAQHVEVGGEGGGPLRISWLTSDERDQAEVIEDVEVKRIEE